ncbi:MAG TPA: branched-chain amino acid ABC transporter permease [Thermoleophilaceae bacterium]|nr:branched-chain amino acid ABC transporter permease [Thermoleophilaceae bacterium]
MSVDVGTRAPGAVAGGSLDAREAPSGLADRLHRLRNPSTLIVGYGPDLHVIRSRFGVACALIALAVAIALPAFVGPFHLRLLNLSLIAVIGAVALNLLVGTAGLISLGQAAFLALGAFTAGGLVHYTDAPAWVTLPAATLAGAVLGLVVGVPSLRLKHLYLAVTTFVLHFAVVLGATAFQAQAVQSAGIVMPTLELGPIRLESRTDWYYFVLVLALISIVIGVNLLRSRIGRSWAALRDRDIAAEALGVSITRAKLSAFVFTSAVVSFAGAISGYFAGVVSAETYTLELAISYLAMIIIGGLGSVLGAVLGAFLITWLPYLIDETLRAFGFEVGPGRISGIHDGVFALLILGFLLFEPRGLAELWRRLRTYITLWPFRYVPLERRER